TILLPLVTANPSSADERARLFRDRSLHSCFVHWRKCGDVCGYRCVARAGASFPGRRSARYYAELLSGRGGGARVLVVAELLQSPGGHGRVRVGGRLSKRKRNNRRRRFAEPRRAR